MMQNNNTGAALNLSLSQLQCSAAVFDLDGTLLDSLWVWHAVDEIFFAARGLSVPHDYFAAIHSLTFRQTADYTVARFGLAESPEDVMAEWNRLSFGQYRDHVKLKPGAREYLAGLRARGILLGAATCLTTRVLKTVLRQNGVYDWFAAVVSADEVPRGKEFPDIYRLAAARLGLQPACCVAFDDVSRALVGIRAAGMTPVAVFDPDARQNWDEMCRLSDGQVLDFLALLQ